jgi:hypothetical protein
MVASPESNIPAGSQFNHHWGTASVAEAEIIPLGLRANTVTLPGL